MKYIIEVSFDYECSDTLEYIKNIADACKCEYNYEIIEQNSHRDNINSCIVSLYFCDENVNYLKEFIIQCKKDNKLYIESIYNSTKNELLYGSKYFVTKKMDKYAARQFISERRERSYSEDEKIILSKLERP